MADIWFISDTHFFHENILRFTDKFEKPIRPQFSSVEEMNAKMVELWNKNIKPQDKVYHLGDVAVGVEKQSEFTALMRSLNGHKRLILGNHDHLHSEGYKSFDTVELWTGGKFKQWGFVASHIPLRYDQMRDGEFNVHGHIHQNLIMESDFNQETQKFDLHPDKQYICVCVEHTNYAPVHIEEIKKIIDSRR